MDKTIRHKFLLGLMLLTALFSSVPTSVFAASNSAYLNGASGSAQTGNSFTVSVDGTVSNHWWGSGPNSADGIITFPASRLKVLSIDDKTGAAFPYSETTIDNTAGTITIKQRTGTWAYIKPNITVHLLSITFQALTPGVANVTFSSMSYSTGTAATTGGTYTITAPPPPTPTPTPTPKPTPKPSTKPTITPKPSVQPTPTPTPAVEETPPPVTQSDGGLKIQDVKVTVTREEGRIAWKMNSDDATATVTYGTTKGSQKKKAEVIKNKDGGYETSLKELSLGTLYHFTIKATANDDLEGGTYSGTLTTRGYPVQLTIQQNNLLLPGAKIRIGERTFVANKDGIVTTELSNGDHTAQVTPANSDESYPVKFTIAKKTMPASGNPDLQSFVLNVSTIGNTSGVAGQYLLPIFGAVGAALAVIGGIVGFVLMRKRQAENNEQLTSVDTDLLSANYGRPVENIYQNTPMPNLETNGGGPAGIFQEQPLEPAPPPDSTTPASMFDAMQTQQPQPAYPSPAVDLSTAGPDPGSLSQEQQLGQQVEPSIDTTNLPLPPLDATAMPNSIDAGTPVQLYSEDEQLAAEVVDVESSAKADQPDAIYNEATGELNILHGGERAINTETPVDEDIPVEPSIEATPNNDLDIQHSNTANDSDQLPQASLEVAH
jgi:hypothetical protein